MQLDSRVEDILFKISKSIKEYQRDNYGDNPTWVILDAHTRHILKTSKEYIVGGHIGNESYTVSSIKGLKIAISDSYRGTIIETVR